MKTRRAFITTSTLGLFTPSAIQAAISDNPKKMAISPVIRQASEGEIYYVRENTPITIFLSKKTDNIETTSFCTEQILPGNGIATHKHLNEDEIFHFSSGTGVFVIDDQEMNILPGTVAFVPRGIWHGLRNTSAELLIFSFGYSPAGFEDFFRQIGALKGLPFQAKSKEEIVNIARKNGMIYK
jgi:mannose-6-phosphate isomerase-like protein (cupin superfamily)